jgi:hypothetical protein
MFVAIASEDQDILANRHPFRTWGMFATISQLWLCIPPLMMTIVTEDFAQWRQKEINGVQLRHNQSS